MKNDVAKVLKIQLDILVTELRAIREKPKQTYAEPLYVNQGERHMELIVREVRILEELQPLLNSTVRVLRLNQERSRSWE
jgi:hypothetical protein